MSTIAAWLDGLGLGQYATVFDANAIDMETLPHLTEADLEKVNVALGHRKRILRAIAALTNGNFGTTAGLHPQTMAAPISEGERRQLTVLFCDLVGSTALAVQLDPEDLSAVIRRFQGTCAAIIKQGGGHIARYMGDGILAYFGYPQAHEDDAESAVRAGLDLVAKVGQLLLPSHDPLQIRVGIATGVVIVGESIGEGSSREQAAVGETPNLASRSSRAVTGWFLPRPMPTWPRAATPSSERAASERSRAASKPSCPASLRSSLAGRMN